jgi:hypothetical protein
MTAQPIDDVRAHVHLVPDADNSGIGPDLRAESARSPARARVIPLRPERRQEGAPIKDEPSGGALVTELRAGAAAAKGAVAGSELGGEPMTVLAALEQVVPTRDEHRGSKLRWVVMTVAGLARLGIVSAGALVIAGGATRIRAAVLCTVLLAALAVSAVAGYAAG